MSISGVSASTTTQQLQRPAGPGKEIRQGIDNLKTAIESGDLDATKAAYESLSKLQSDKQSGTSSTSSSTSTSSTSSTSQRKDPLSTLLSSVGEALESGDMSQVQAAFEAAGPKGPGGPGGGRGGPPPGGGGAGGPPPDGAGGPSDEMKSAFGSFAESLQSGDLTSAQSSYNALTDLLKSSAEDDGSDSSNSSSTSSSSSTSAADRFSSVLSDIGSALQSGNLGSAQKLFSSLAPRGSQGVDVYA